MHATLLNIKKKKKMSKITVLLPLLLKLLSLATIVTSSSDPALTSFISCLTTYNSSSSSSSSSYSSSILANIYMRDDPFYNSTLRAYARSLTFLSPETPKPLAIVTASHESHVQATVVCTNSHHLELRIRSGGHDYEGLSYVSKLPFIILDMFNLRSIEIDMATQTALVQSGATLGELYYNIAKRSNLHGFPAGVCPTLGVGGHFTGGGYGNMLRKYGLSIDNVLDARIVNVNAQILVRKSMGEDLFWALRGGGGASFCVILSWKIRLVPVTKTVTYFNKTILLNEGALEVLYQWQLVASTKLPKEVFIRAMVDVSGKTTHPNVRFIGLFLGQTHSLLPLLDKNLGLLNLTRKDCVEMSWVNSTLYWNEFPPGTPLQALLNRTRETTSYFKSKSDYIKRFVSKNDLKKVIQNLRRWGIGLMQWNPYGGRMSEISAMETAYAHRSGYLFGIQYIQTWNHASEAEPSLERMREFYASMAPYVSRKPREAYLNYRDIDIGSNLSNKTDYYKGLIYGTKYFRGNFQRLTKVKAMVDPHNFFKFQQSIPLPISSVRTHEK